MEEKNIFFILKDSIPLCLSLNYICIVYNHPIEITNNLDPILKLDFNYKQIDEIKKIISKNKTTKFLYFNKEKVHEILYEKEEEIELEYKEENKTIEFYFYLTLLIRFNPDIYDYKYDENYIIKLHQENEQSNKNKFDELIKSKFVVELSREYILDYGLDENNELTKKLNNFIEINTQKIENVLNILSDLNVNLDPEHIISIPIDELYLEIIIGLINMKKFIDYNYVMDILKQLNLEQIDITKKIYENLEKFFEDKTNETLMDSYKIKEEKNLDDEIKINFAYILIKYILKNDYYIFNLKFICDLRENLKNILVRNKNVLNDLKNIKNNIYKKIKEIVEILCLKPKSFIKNNLQKYYNDFIKGKKYTDEFNITVENRQLNIIEYINQIFNIPEYRDEYERLAENKKEENIIDELAINEDGNIYKGKLKEAIKNNRLKNLIKSNSNLNKDNFNQIFKIKTLDDDEIIKELENKIEFGKIKVSQKVAENFGSSFTYINSKNNENE